MELIINNHTVLKKIKIERAEKMTSLCSPLSYSEKQFLDLLTFFGRKESNIIKALDYAKSLDFSKNHLKSSYLSHPLRLASFLIKINPSIDADYIVISLLHNIPETTEITVEDLKNSFGEKVADCIKTLVLDRNVSFPTIEESYYKEIFARGSSLILVKLFDKIDNLFVLCLNPDDEVRKNYIIEVRKKLLPFVYDYNLQLGEYLDELLKTTLNLGYSEKLKKKLIEYQQSL